MHSTAIAPTQPSQGAATMRTMNARYDIGPATRSLTEKAIAPVLLVLLSAFHREKISYCYWKSSRRVPAVLDGESDVDLLVAREDQHRAQAVLLARGFKHFPPVTGQDHPAISSFLDYDERSGQLIHVHFHVHLIVGERLLKNYRLPLEHIVLARAVAHPTLPIRILDPASEAILLVVRACLELRRLDPMTLRGWQATTHKFELDRRELAARVDRIELRSAAAQLLSEELAEPVANAFYNEQPLERQAALRRRMTRHFASHRTYNAFEARIRSAGRAMLWAAGHLNKRLLHAPRPWNRRTPGGGCVVAILGVDGSGKSTSVAAMRAWLGSEIDVVPIYFGTGDGRPSLLLRPFKLMMPLITRMLRRKPKGASHGKLSDHAPRLLYSALLMVWATVVALDKRKKLIAARRGASRGLVVVADRYPQDQILGFNDGPLLTRLTAAPRWLRRFEANAYALAERLPPDLVIKLVVTPETAARREPDMDPAVIRERITALPRLQFPRSRVVSVDAERPLADVLRAIKHEIWRLL
jgi:hypothetical protein